MSSSRAKKVKKAPRPSLVEAEAPTSDRDDDVEDQGADSGVKTGGRKVKILGLEIQAPEYIAWNSTDDSKNTLYPFYL